MRPGLGSLSDEEMGQNGHQGPASILYGSARCMTLCVKQAISED